MRNAKIFAGSSHSELASDIAAKLGEHLAEVRLDAHSNSEVAVELAVSVRNKDIFVIQSASESSNDHLMELLAIINACRTGCAWRITAIVPCFPYAKQSKKKGRARSPVMAKLVADMLKMAGADHIITLDLHHEQMQGFFACPVDNLLAEPTLAKYVAEHFFDSEEWGTSEPGNGGPVVVSKNPGGVKRVTLFADRLKIDFALMHQDRSVPAPLTATSIQNNNASLSTPSSATPGSEDTTSGSASLITPENQPPLSIFSVGSESVNHLESVRSEWHEDGLQLVGHVKGRLCFLLDDMIDKADSFIAAANLLCRKGASAVVLLATHGIFGDNALARIEECSQISAVVVTNSYPISFEKRASSTKLRVINVSTVLAEAIRRTHNGESISYLFQNTI